MIRSLSVTEVEYIAFNLAQELMSYNEPIPNFDTRFPNALESCLAVPFQSFGGTQFYKGISGKASILFYLMIKNHPFHNGNKRIAMATLLTFLYKNGKWIEVDQKEFYNFAVWIAQSNAKLKQDTVNAIKTFIDAYIINLKV
jgi:death-on-curing family protein